MKKVVIKSWVSDLGIDLETFKSSGAFCIGVEFGNGFVNDDIEENFYFQVCNFDGLKEYHQRDNLPDTWLMQGYVIQDEFSFDKLKNYIEQVLRELDAQDYVDLILKLESLFGWEYSEELRSKGRIRYTFDGEWI